MERVQKPQTPIHRPLKRETCVARTGTSQLFLALASALSCRVNSPYSAMNGEGGREGSKALGVGRQTKPTPCPLNALYGARDHCSGSQTTPQLALPGKQRPSRDKLGGRCQAQGQDHGHAQLGSTVDDRVNARTNARRNHRTPQRGLRSGQVATDSQVP